MKPVAIIPARGGSKRIPGKNIIDFCGKPMIAWTIEAAIQSRCFSRIVVSTDCKNIATISKNYGAEVPFIRTLHADDYSTVSEATLWTAERLLRDQCEEPQHIVQLMANTPLRKCQTIINFVSHLYQIENGSLISCFEPSFGAPNWAIQVKNDKGVGEFVFKSDKTTRSQDLTRYLLPTGAVWGASLSHLRAYKSFYGDEFNVFEIPWLEALDIDTPDELEICKILADATICG